MAISLLRDDPLVPCAGYHKCALAFLSATPLCCTIGHWTELTPTVWCSTGWCVVAAAEQTEADEEDEETRLRAELEHTSLPVLHQRAREA